MVTPIDLTLEASATWATLAVRGSVQHADAARAVRLCLALPRKVRGLRLDFCEATDISGDAHDAIIALIHSWRRARGGLLRIVPEERAMEMLTRVQQTAERLPGLV